MMLDITLQAVAMEISRVLSEPIHFHRVSPVGGGNINTCYRLETVSKTFFCKLHSTASLSMFDAEKEGLHELAAAGALRVPNPICCARTDDKAFLVMEYIHFGRLTSESSILLGRKLALLHKKTSESFGWNRDNFIGITPQPNAWDGDWIRFYCEKRLAHQLNLLAEKGYKSRLNQLGERLLANLPAFFRGYQPVPSLLHGDLWGGNYGVDDHGEPVIFDPAVYYGDRETDLAMTELFGGFPESFYAAYRDAWPMDVGYGHRKTLYNLYHVLNHANMYGSGYAQQAERMIEQLLGDLG